MKKSDFTSEQRAVESGKLSRSAKILVLIGAFLGSMLVWIYAIGYDSTLFESTYTGVEVTLTGTDELAENSGLTLAEGQRFSSITIVAKGKRSELNALNSKDFSAVVDVSTAVNAGEQTFNIVVFSPNGIEVVSQSSYTVILYIDEFTQRTDMLSVAVDTGTNYVMTEGVTFVDATANPISILVSGPRSRLDEIEGAYVRFDLDGVEISEPLYGYGRIELRDKNGEVIDNPYISISEQTAYVTVTVTKQKVIPVRVAFTGGVFKADEVSVRLSLSSVTVSGSPSDIDALDELVRNVDESSIDGSESFSFNIGSMLPEGVANESGASKITVDVTLPKMAIRTYTIGIGSITVTDLPKGAEYKVLSPIDVSLMGVREAFDTVDRRAITASVDFSNVHVNDDGSYSAVPTIDLGGALGVYVFGEPESVVFSVDIPQE